jgi:A/G-specific adenine glycosylase
VAAAARRASAGAATPAGDLSARRIRRLRCKILDWYGEHRRDLPWRRTVDPYAILVAEVMLQQTQVARVVGKYEPFLRAYPTLEALASAPTAGVLRHWAGLGYNARAVRLQRCAQAAVNVAHGRPAELPASLEQLRQLPGIGPYTARAILVFAWNADLAAVDANVRRVLTHELDLPRDLTPAALQAVAETVLPTGRARDWHNALMDYGALVLTARATAIAPRARQGPYQGSTRWYRARMLAAVLDRGRLPLEKVAAELGLAPTRARALAQGLARDGLLTLRDDAIDAP